MQETLLFHSQMERKLLQMTQFFLKKTCKQSMSKDVLLMLKEHKNFIFFCRIFTKLKTSRNHPVKSNIGSVPFDFFSQFWLRAGWL